MKKIKLLIVEDSVLMRETIKSIVEEDESIEVIGEVTSGEDAIKFVAKNKPDVITMDVNLYGMNGLEATRNIMSTNPVPIVIMSSAFDPKSKLDTMRALDAGALDVFEKPKGIGTEEFEIYSKELIRHIKNLSQIKVITRKFKNKEKPEVKQTPAPINLNSINLNKVKLVAIGSSTGGPEALKIILSSLPENFPVPIVHVQHISKNFTSSLVSWLDSISPLKVTIAKDFEELKPGYAYFPDENYHMTITRNLHCRYVDTPPLHSAKPSVSVLFKSVADNIGENSLGIILTGMGSDGSLELGFIKNKGGITVAQSKESCVVFGMPGEAVKLGSASFTMSTEEIISLLKKLGNNYEK